LARSVAPALLALTLTTFLMAGAAPEARCEDDLDDVLGGFDDEAGEPSEGFVEDSDTDDILGGFDDELGEGKAPSKAEGPEDRFWELTGSVSLGGSVNYLKHDAFAGPGRSTDYGGLQRLRTRLNLQLDVDLPFEWKGRLAGFGFYDWAYLANGRSNYTSDVLDMYEWEVDFQEVWVQGSLLDDLDLKVGRQIVNWGRSDNLRVLDVLNPLDNREPGLVDIEDLRRPVAMVKADYYLGHWALSAIAIPEIRFSLNPPFGSDFAPVLTSLGTLEAFVAPEKIPDESFSNTEWAVALMGIFSGWDVSLHYARHWRDLPYLKPVIAIIPNPPPDPPDVSLAGTKLRHSRLTLVGSGANYTLGSWLFKAEIAWIDGIDYTTSTLVDLRPFGFGFVDVPTGNVEKSRLDFMGGIEYYGFTNTNIALEIANRHIFGFRNDMKPLFGTKENMLETALRITRTFMNERLELTAVGIIFGSYAQDGSIVRLDFRYDLRDALELGGGIVFYQEGDFAPFDTIKRNDRFFFEIKYSF
jgi:hypothetical protein